MKIALVHDYLKEYGGAERVLENLHNIWPDAPVYTSFVDWQGLGPHADRLKKWNIKTSWANNWLMKKFHSPLRFLAPWIWESFDFHGFDVVISSSGWYISRAVITHPETVHICYLHHPPRHLYGYATAIEWQKHILVKIYATIINHSLRKYDFLAAQRVNYFIANSKETQSRITKFYRRESTVIYPPVKVQSSPLRPPPLSFGGTSEGQAKRKRKDYFLCVSRLARAKHLDLAIEACQELNLPLKIVGKGRDEKYLKSKATKPHLIQFLGEVADEELNHIYENAKALIFPSEDEEFGIVVVEALSHGVPVIALKSGGVPEIITDGKTGFLFDELNLNSLITALVHFNNIYYHSGRPAKNLSTLQTNCRQRAQQFSEEKFVEEIKKFVEEKRKEYQKILKK